MSNEGGGVTWEGRGCLLGRSRCKKSLEGRAGHIRGPKEHGNRRTNKGGVRQRLTIPCKEQCAHQAPGYLGE